MGSDFSRCGHALGVGGRGTACGGTNMCCAVAVDCFGDTQPSGATGIMTGSGRRRGLIARESIARTGCGLCRGSGLGNGLPAREWLAARCGVRDPCLGMGTIGMASGPQRRALGDVAQCTSMEKLPDKPGLALGGRVAELAPHTWLGLCSVTWLASLGLLSNGLRAVGRRGLSPYSGVREGGAGLAERDRGPGEGGRLDTLPVDATEDGSPITLKLSVG